MAQTGYTPIQLYYSSTTTNAPTAGNLANGELAINITDGKLFYKDNANAVQVIGWKTTPTSAGGTGLTSYTAGDTLYYASGTTLTKLAIGTAFQAFQVNAGATAPSWQPSATSVLTTQGDLLYASGANTLARLAKNTTATRYLSNTGTSNNPVWAQVDISNGVTGTLPATSGGTGQSSYAVGDLIYADTTTSLAKLADVATGNALISGGVSTAPSWGKIGLTTHVSGTLPVGNGGTGVTSSTGTTNVVLSNSPSLLSPSISTTTTASGAVVSTLNGTGQNTTANSTTYSVTFGYSAKVFWIALGSGDGALCITNYITSVITILGTTTGIVNSSTPLSSQLGIYKSANSHVVSFVTGSAASSTYGGWQVMCLSSTAA